MTHQEFSAANIHAHDGESPLNRRNWAALAMTVDGIPDQQLFALMEYYETAERELMIVAARTVLNRLTYDDRFALVVAQETNVRNKA